MKPRLPPSVELLLPEDVVRHIYKFVPTLKKEKIRERMGLQKQLDKLQKSPKQTSMYLHGLEDFILS